MLKSINPNFKWPSKWEEGHLISVKLSLKVCSFVKRKITSLLDLQLFLLYFGFLKLDSIHSNFKGEKTKSNDQTV